MVTRDWIRSLPKTETHLHIEGALPYAKLRELDPERYAETPPSHDPDFRFDTFQDFERDLLNLAVPWFTSPERYHEGAKAVFASSANEGAVYIETSFHAGILPLVDCPGDAIVDAILAAAPPGVTVRVFLGMPRNAWGTDMRSHLEDALTWPQLSGIDLHGLETLPFEAWTPTYWKRAAGAGKTLKAHAGEFGPAANVRQAVEALGVRRIQHGTRAIEDPDLLPWLADHEVTFDLCPISNLRLRVISTADAHPIRTFQDAGINCTISTDDPLVLGNNLSDEYRFLNEHLGFEASDLIQIARNGFAVADLPSEEKQGWLDQLEAQAKTG